MKRISLLLFLWHGLRFPFVFLFFFSLNWLDDYSQFPLSAIPTRTSKQCVPTVAFIFRWHVHASSNMRMRGCRICIFIYRWRAEMQARMVMTFRPENSNRVTSRGRQLSAFPFFVYSALWLLFVWSLCLRYSTNAIADTCWFHCSKRY